MKPNIGQGDTGKTHLLGGKETHDKDSAQIEAYGTLDELNSLVGYIRSQELPEEIDKILERVQDDVFRAEAHVSASHGWEKFPHLPRFGKNRVRYLEERLQYIEKKLPALANFVLPGGTPQAALCDMARTLARRCERRLVTFMRGAKQTSSRRNTLALAYVNRLSDLFFAMERWLNMRAGKEQPTWVGKEKKD